MVNKIELKKICHDMSLILMGYNSWLGTANRNDSLVSYMTVLEGTLDQLLDILGKLRALSND